ncbi:MAG: terminase small subunit [Eubacterium sp.]|nr:terminase small subunit [Eubacterium sp.]
MALKKKQIVFCKEYVKDYNGTQAAIRAGYKESNAASQASRLLSDPEIIEEIKKQQRQLLEASCLTEEKVIKNLEEVLDRALQKTQ